MEQARENEFRWALSRASSGGHYKMKENVTASTQRKYRPGGWLRKLAKTESQLRECMAERDALKQRLELLIALSRSPNV